MVVDDAAGAQCIDPRSERQHLLGLVRARREDPKSPSGRQRCELVQEPALADAGLTNEGNDPELSGADLVEQRVEFRRLVLSPQQRHSRLGRAGRQRRHRRLDAGDGSGRVDLFETVCTRSQDLLVKPSGFGLGLGSQLTLEDVDAELVLTQGRRPAAVPPVHTHHEPVHGFLERIELEQASSGPQRLLVRFGRALVGQ